MKKYAWMGIASVLFITFQNCAPPPQSRESSDSPVQKNETRFNKILANEFSILSLWESGCDESCTITELRQSQPQYLDIIIQSDNSKKIGFIETWPLDQRLLHSKYCLAAEKLEALKEILGGAEVCEPILPDNYFDGRVCTMSYTNPYALLKADQQSQVSLGEKTSGCDIPIDLCGAKATQLKQWRNSVVGHLDDPAVANAPINDQGDCR